MDATLWTSPKMSKTVGDLKDGVACRRLENPGAGQIREQNMAWARRLVLPTCCGVSFFSLYMYKSRVTHAVHVVAEA